MVFVLFITVSCKDEKSTVKNNKTNSFKIFDEIDNIEIISYPSRTQWLKEDVYDYRHVDFVKDSVYIKKRYIRDRFFLNDLQIKKLKAVFKKINDIEKSTTAACYDPRHIIVFYKLNKPIGYIEYCFECGNNDFSENLKEIAENFSEEKGAELEKLFKEFGVKYIGNNKQIEKDERDLYEELLSSSN